MEICVYVKTKKILQLQWMFLVTTYGCVLYVYERRWYRKIVNYCIDVLQSKLIHFFYITTLKTKTYFMPALVICCHVKSYLILVLNKIACHCKIFPHLNYDVYVWKKYKNPVVVVCKCDTFFVFHFQSFMSVSKNPS